MLDGLTCLIATGESELKDDSSIYHVMLYHAKF